MLRKQILTTPHATSVPLAQELDIAALATVWVTSETVDAPIDNVFDHHRGPGGSRWIAAEPGEQQFILAFDTAQVLRQIRLEVEEGDVSRTQELQLSFSQDGGQTYRELLRQEYTFSPPGTTFEREAWTVHIEEVTHLQLWIKPDKGGKPCRATLTSLVLE